MCGLCDKEYNLSVDIALNTFKNMSKEKDATQGFSRLS